MVLDIVVAVILFLSMLVAWFRGFIREVLTILGLGGAAVGALYGSPYIIPSLSKWMIGDKSADEARLFSIIPYEFIAIGLAYLFVFIVVFILLSLATHWLSKTAKEAGLGALDRSLGVLFGLLRAVILIGLLFIPFNVVMDEPEKQEWFGDSYTLPYVDYTARLMRAAIPAPIPDTEEDAEDKEKNPTENTKRGTLDILQEKAMKNAEDAARILRDSPHNDKQRTGAKQRPPKDGQSTDSAEKGYGSSDRDSLQQLFENKLQNNE